MATPQHTGRRDSSSLVHIMDGSAEADACVPLSWWWGSSPADGPTNAQKASGCGMGADDVLTVAAAGMAAYGRPKQRPKKAGRQASVSAPALEFPPSPLTTATTISSDEPDAMSCLDEDEVLPAVLGYDCPFLPGVVCESDEILWRNPVGWDVAVVCGLYTWHLHRPMLQKCSYLALCLQKATASRPCSTQTPGTTPGEKAASVSVALFLDQHDPGQLANVLQFLYTGDYPHGPLVCPPNPLLGGCIDSYIEEWEELYAGTDEVHRDGREVWQPGRQSRARSDSHGTYTDSGSSEWEEEEEEGDSEDGYSSVYAAVDAPGDADADAKVDDDILTHTAMYIAAASVAYQPMMALALCRVNAATRHLRRTHCPPEAVVALLQRDRRHDYAVLLLGMNLLRALTALYEQQQTCEEEASKADEAVEEEEKKTKQKSGEDAQQRQQLLLPLQKALVRLAVAALPLLAASPAFQAQFRNEWDGQAFLPRLEAEALLLEEADDSDREDELDAGARPKDGRRRSESTSSTTATTFFHALAQLRAGAQADRERLAALMERNRRAAMQKRQEKTQAQAQAQVHKGTGRSSSEGTGGSEVWPWSV